MAEKAPVYYKIETNDGSFKYRIVVSLSEDFKNDRTKLYFNVDYANHLWWANHLARKMAKRIRKFNRPDYTIEGVL